MNITVNGRNVVVNEISLTGKTVTFTDERDGVGSCAYESVGDIPTVQEITTAIGAVLRAIE